MTIEEAAKALDAAAQASDLDALRKEIRRIERGERPRRPFAPPSATEVSAFEQIAGDLITEIES